MSRLCLCLLLVTISCIDAAGLWGGVNSYFLHALSESDRAAHLGAMKDSGLKVVRIFINGVYAGSKGSSSVDVPELEPETVGVYDDKVLEMIDKLMYEAHGYGVKLLIALHDRYSLGCFMSDAYVTKYNLPVSKDCQKVTDNQPKAFYTNQNAQADFDRRIEHILTHKNKYFGDREWGQIEEAVFGFEPENEAQGHMDESNTNWDWTCNRAAVMKKYISDGIVVVTGGGNVFSNSLKDKHFDCPDIDVVSIHDYSLSSYSSSNLDEAKSKAEAHGKRLILEEYGATGSDDLKASKIKQFLEAATNSGIPWLPWEFVKPGSNTQDFEFWTDSNTWTTISSFAKQSIDAENGAFVWPSID